MAHNGAQTTSVKSALGGGVLDRLGDGQTAVPGNGSYREFMDSIRRFGLHRTNAIRLDEHKYS